MAKSPYELESDTIPKLRALGHDDIAYDVQTVLSTLKRQAEHERSDRIRAGDAARQAEAVVRDIMERQIGRIALFVTSSIIINMVLCLLAIAYFSDK